MKLRITSRGEAHEACDGEISHLISIQDPDADVSKLRPASISVGNQLLLLFDDVPDTANARGPKESHIRTLIDWVESLDRDQLHGLVVHCEAGVSRSTAAAWLVLLVLDGDTPCEVHLERVANCSGGDFCWPNNLMVEFGDHLLGRGGVLCDVLRDWKEKQRVE